MTFLFASAVDSSCPRLADGTHADAMDRDGHYARWEDDLALAAAIGLRALRYGPSYYRTHLAPERFDWEPWDEPLARMRALRIRPIACLCDAGMPSWISGAHDVAFPVLFAEYARAFAQRYPWITEYTPIRDVAGFARREATHADGSVDEARYARALRNLCMGHELAVEAILAERPGATIVHAERAEHTHAAGAAARPVAERANARRFAPLDLVTGRELAPGVAGWLSTRGFTSHDLAFFRERRAPEQRWLGLEYVPSNERRVTATERVSAVRSRHGFRVLATEYWRRYRMPLFHAGTHADTRSGAAWLRRQWEEVVALRAGGVPVLGFTWAPLTDQPGARGRARDVPGLADQRRALRGVGDAYTQLIARWAPVVDEHRGELQLASSA
jgi:hypothetical protein